MNPTIQNRRMTYLPEDVNDGWEAYKEAHPEQSYNGLVVTLLREYLACVPGANQK